MITTPIPKKLILSLCASLMALVLGACSDNNHQQASTPNGNKTTTQEDKANSNVVRITFWHSMDGELGKTLQGIINTFNKANPQYHIDAVYKGDYKDSMNAAIAAYRAGQSPDIAQVFEIGTATMMYSGGAIKPVQEMSEEVNDPINPKAFLSAVASYYSSPEGKLIALPFNSSTPILYYNKDMFAKAGLPDAPPQTYAELMEDSKKLKEAGFCGYTTTWPAWILLENFSAWHNQPFASKNNGFNGLDARLEINNPVTLKLLTDLAQMSKNGEFVYGGRGDKATQLFTSGKCGIYTGSSGSRSQIATDSKFKFGIGKLPYFANVKEAPQNAIIGGASLWVFNGKNKKVYEGITKFFKYLTSPEVAAKWHQETGYVPVVISAYNLSKKQGYYDEHPGADIPIQQLNTKTTDASRGIRLGSLPDIRDIEESDMEQVFNGSMTPKDALADIQKRGNEVLIQFEQDHKK